MKKRLSLVCFAAAVSALFGPNQPMASAQLGPVGRLGTQAYEPDTFQRVAADIKLGMPGRLWVSSNFVDQGLGYQGSYLTVGGKTRLFEDILDGRWLTEARLHHSIEDDGGFFANVGIERVFSVDAAKAEVVTGVWYDFDGDQQGNFGHDFSQVSLNAAIKTRRWDLIGNGYFPVGVTDYTSAEATGSNFFLGNNILLQPGIDTALQGFDVTLRMKPKQLAFVNGSFEVGGYGYSSEILDAFGGGRMRLGMQTKRGLVLGAEINHDERFDTTGGFSVGYHFGAVGGTNSEYAGIGRDLEMTNRNDHIVRFNQSVELAIDPRTGAAYNVVHVNNTADPARGDGSVENPYSSLREGQNNSNVNDIVYVNRGDGTTLNYETGIRLKNNQILLSNGADQIIPIQDGLQFRIVADGTGSAIISNPGGYDVVRLANNNQVRGITIDAEDAENGITGNSKNGGIIDATTVTDAHEYGILVSNVSGNWTFNNNNLSNNGIDGLFVNGGADPTSQFVFTGNTVNSNGFDGIHLARYNAASVLFDGNTTSGNGRHGLFLIDQLSDGITVNLLNTNSNFNGQFGVVAQRGDGNLNVLDSNVVNNLGGGVKTDTWTNQTTGQRTFIGSTADGTTTISNNGTGAGGNLQFDLFADNVQQDILVTGLSLDNGGRGIFGTVSGDSSVVNLNIRDMVSISNNTADGIRLLARGGATINTNISNLQTPALQIIGNGEAAGAGIFLSADAPAGVPPSVINANINNVAVEIPGSTAFGEAIDISSLNNSYVEVDINNSTLTKSLVGNVNNTVTDGDTGLALNFQNDGGRDVNRVTVRNTTIVTDTGITLTAGPNTYSDLEVVDSTIQALGADAPEGSRASDAPFDDGFGDRGIAVRLTGDATTVEADSLTRLLVDNVTIRDFAGLVFPTYGGGSINGLSEAMSGAAIDIGTFGDANLLFTLEESRILNNGAGYNNDADNESFFNDQPVVLQEDPNNLLFVDAVSINAFDSSFISSRINNNLFQDNFERGLAIDTYDSATINASIANNAFDGNDRGEDGDNNIPLSDPAVALDDDGFIDFEAINNEEFFRRSYETTIGIDFDGGGILDGNDDDIPDLLLSDVTTPGFANMCIGLSNNVFQLAAVLQDFSTAPGDFQLGLDGATNGPLFSTGTTATTFGICDQLITNEQLFFEANGFASPIH